MNNLKKLLENVDPEPEPPLELEYGDIPEDSIDYKRNIKSALYPLVVKIPNKKNKVKYTLEKGNIRYLNVVRPYGNETVALLQALRRNITRSFHFELTYIPSEHIQTLNCLVLLANKTLKSFHFDSYLMNVTPKVLNRLHLIKSLSSAYIRFDCPTLTSLNISRKLSTMQSLKSLQLRLRVQENSAPNFRELTFSRIKNLDLEKFAFQAENTYITYHQVDPIPFGPKDLKAENLALSSFKNLKEFCMVIQKEFKPTADQISDVLKGLNPESLRKLTFNFRIITLEEEFFLAIMKAANMQTNLKSIGMFFYNTQIKTPEGNDSNIFLHFSYLKDLPLQHIIIEFKETNTKFPFLQSFSDTIPNIEKIKTLQSLCINLPKNSDDDSIDHGLSLSKLSSLPDLKKLKINITGTYSMSSLGFAAPIMQQIESLQQLEDLRVKVSSLSLGETNDSLGKNLTSSLGKMINLKRFKLLLKQSDLDCLVDLGEEIKNLKNLTQLTLEFPNNSGSSSFEFQKLLWGLTYLPSLQKLKISFKDSWSVSDKTLLMMPPVIPYLKNLRILKLNFSHRKTKLLRGGGPRRFLAQIVDNNSSDEDKVEVKSLVRDVNKKAEKLEKVVYHEEDMETVFLKATKSLKFLHTYNFSNEVKIRAMS